MYQPILPAVMLNYVFYLLCPCLSIFASEVIDFNDAGNNKNMIFFLSTPKSGSNVITGCLSAITRKPISWFNWGDSILDSSSEHRDHISYNRLGLTLISDTPLLYRTHFQFDKLMQVPSEINKLIFVTRNPKELIYRKFFLQASPLENPDAQFIEDFLIRYLKAFEVYEAWNPNNRRLIFYEDFIAHDNEILLQLLQFMEEPPIFLEDFIINKQEYISRLLESYAQQHKRNFGGSSSKNGPKEIYYTNNASPENLRFIDEYLKKKKPKIWNKYLKRFKTKNQAINNDKVI